MRIDGQGVKAINEILQKNGIATKPFMQKMRDKTVRYELIKSIVWIVVDIASIICSTLMFKYSVAIGEPSAFDYLIGVCAVLVCMVAGVAAIAQGLDIIACITFPEKILIKYIKSVVSTTKN